jgi:hypothetical protein
MVMAIAAIADTFQRGSLREHFIPSVIDEPLRLMLAFLLVAGTAASLVILVASLCFALAQIREGSAGRRKSEILERLAMHAALGNQSTALEALAKRDPRAVERALAEFIPSIRGYQSERMVELEVFLGFEARRFKYRTSHRPTRSERKSLRRYAKAGVQDRQTLYAVLAGADEGERVVAASTLVRTAESAALARVLAFATTQSLSIRALLAEKLRAHLLELDPAAINDLLDCDDPHQVAATLEILVAWQRVFEVPSFAKLLKAADARVRALALRALPLIAGVLDAEPLVCFALSSSNSEVRAAAAFAAGRLKFAAAVNPLTAALRDFEPAVASAAGQALARLGPAGRAALRSAIERGGDSADASIEALESLAFESATFKDLASPL